MTVVYELKVVSWIDRYFVIWSFLHYCDFIGANIVKVEKRVRHVDPVQGQRIVLMGKLDQDQILLYLQRGSLIIFVNNMNFHRFHVNNSLIYCTYCLIFF